MLVRVLRNQPGPYQIQASINAVTATPPPLATDWPQVVQLDDQLLADDPSPVVAYEY